LGEGSKKEKSVTRGDTKSTQGIELNTKKEKKTPQTNKNPPQTHRAKPKGGKGTLKGKKKKTQPDHATTKKMKLPKILSCSGFTEGGTKEMEKLGLGKGVHFPLNEKELGDLCKYQALGTCGEQKKQPPTHQGRKESQKGVSFRYLKRGFM